jgi:hypothetical protein
VRRRTIAPLQLQLLELGIAVAALFLAAHLNSSASAFLVGVGVLVGALMLLTVGPLGVIRRLTPGMNVLILCLIGIVMALCPIALHAARTTGAVLSLEGGAAVIALTVVGVVRAPRTAPPRPAPPSPPDRPSSAAMPSIRTAGRIAGIARSRLAGRAPVEARRLGRYVGTRRRRRGASPT